MIAFRRGILALSIIVGSISIILLLNFTAPNPTGQRYSSEMPTYDEKTECDGNHAEAILESDLGLPANDFTEAETLCVCKTQRDLAQTRCNTCIAVSYEVEKKVHIPDFVTDSLIIDSKCKENITNDHQFRSFVDAAHQLDRELWYFVRVGEETRVSPYILEQVQSTGGDIVPYFTVPGYIDPVDLRASITLTIALIVLMIMLIWEIRGHLPRFTPQSTQPEPEHDAALTKAERSTRDAEAFKQRIENRVQIQVDVEDARDD